MLILQHNMQTDHRRSKHSHAFFPSYSASGKTEIESTDKSSESKMWFATTDAGFYAITGLSQNYEHALMSYLLRMIFI